MTIDDTSAPVREFCSALAAVIGATLECQASVGPSSHPPAPGYVLSVEARRGGRGQLHLHFDRTQAEALAKRMTAAEEEPDSARVLASLKELCAQAATTVGAQPLTAGMLIDVVAAQLWTDGPHWAEPVLIAIAIAGDDQPLRLALAGTLERISEDDRAADAGASAAGPSIDVILDIDLPLMVRFGCTEMSLKDLIALGPGSLINLARSPDDPVDVLVSNQVVARGEVVTVAGSYGVRIRDVISPADRVRSMEAAL